MPDLQVGQLAAGGVGRERGQPVAVDVVESQLCAGVGPFAADDDPHPGRPAGQVDQPGELGGTRQLGRDPNPTWSSASAITFW